MDIFAKIGSVAAAGAPLTGAQTWEAPNVGSTIGSQYVSGQFVPPNPAYVAGKMPDEGGFTKEGNAKLLEDVQTLQLMGF